MTRDDALAAWERLLLEEGKLAARTLDGYRQVPRRSGETVPITDRPTRWPGRCWPIGLAAPQVTIVPVDGLVGYVRGHGGVPCGTYLR
jgi:hypothetical protein